MNVSEIKILKNDGLLFNFSNNTIVPQVMNGLPKNCFNEKSFSIVTVIFYLFPMFWAYIINSFIARVIGFIGIYLLLKKYVFNRLSIPDSHLATPKTHLLTPNSQLLASLLSSALALSFALLPFYTIYGLSSTGIPLLVYCILNVLNSRHVIASYFYIVLFPFYSSLVLVGYTIIILLGLIMIYFIINKDRRYIQLFKIIAVLSVLYLISEVNLLNQFLLNRSFVTHRLAMGVQEHYNLKTAISKSVLIFLNGHYHAPSSQFFIIIFLFASSLIAFKSIVRDRLIMFYLLFLVAASLIFGLYNWDVFIIIKHRIPLMNMFQFDRFYFLFSVIWYLLAGLIILKLIESNIKRVNILIFSFIILNFIFVLYSNKELYENVHNLLSRTKGSQLPTPNSRLNKKFITYREFYSEDLFQAVKQKIGLCQENFRVVSLGIYPAVAQYNGFYTLDSYSNNYEKTYKEKFRKVIAAELDKSPLLKNYFDNWGSRCYIYSSELGLNFFITDHTVVRNLDLNIQALKQLNCKYIISAVEIMNASQLKLYFVDKFNNNNSPLTVYLYQIY